MTNLAYCTYGGHENVKIDVLTIDKMKFSTESLCKLQSITPELTGTEGIQEVPSESYEAKDASTTLPPRKRHPAWSKMLAKQIGDLMLHRSHLKVLLKLHFSLLVLKANYCDAQTKHGGLR